MVNKTWSLKLLLLYYVTLRLLSCVDVFAGVNDVCMQCPTGCEFDQRMESCKCSDGKLYCKQFHTWLLTVVELPTVDCQVPETPGTTATPGISLDTCSGVHLFQSGGCLQAFLPSVICSYNESRALTMTDSSLRDFPSLSCLPYLGYLNLANNKLQSLPPDAFTETPDIREIFLDYNEISAIHPLTVQGLNQLQYFSITHNSLQTIDVSIFMLPDSFCIINFSYNSIENITNVLHFQLISANMAPSPGLVDFSFNNITGAGGIFGLFGPYQKEDLSAMLKWGWDFRENPLHCDCDLYTVADWLKNLTFATYLPYFNVSCASPPSMKAMALFDVPLDQMTCNVSAQCPNNCLCQNRPAMNTFLVDCSSAGFMSLPDSLPVDKYNFDLTLILTNNSIKKLEPRSYFTRTKIINVSSNALDQIDEGVAKLWTRVELIDLRNNNLKGLPRTMQTLKADVLLLDSHTLLCTCELLEWMPSWLEAARKGNYIRNISCILNKDGRPMNVISASRQDLDCDPKFAFSIVYYWMMGVIFTILVLLSALLVMFRYEVVLVFSFAKRSCKTRFAKVSQFVDFEANNKQYHVFISISPKSDEDLSWVRTNLLPRLETAGLTSYLPPRDCSPGCVEMDEVTKRLHDCAAAVIVLSPDYVTNTSALFQFRQAYSYMVARGGGPLSVLMLRDVPRRAACDPHLRAMLTLRMSHVAEEGIDILLKTLADLKVVALVQDRP